MRLRHERSLVLAPLALAACSSAAPAVGRTEPVAEQIHVAAFEAPHALDSAIAAVAPASADGEGSGAEVVSTASRASGETERVGAYGQPEWTTRRRFARTRVYVLPEGQLEFEQWWRGTFDRGEAAGHLFQTEIGMGLADRFQIDLYGNAEHEDGTTKWLGLQPELRWAPADWGVLPLNPTIYLEYKWIHGGNDVAEGKILLGEELSRDLHWGMNLSCEQELGGSREQELAVTQALSWTLADRQFSVGVEFEYDRVTAAGSRDDPEHQFYAGPSLQWRPTEQTHLDIVPLRGWHDAHDWRVFVVFGYDFGGRTEGGPHAPVSSKSR